MPRTFIYGTLKTNEMNFFHLSDESHGKAMFVGKGRTSKKYPLIMVDFKGYVNCPAVIDEEGFGHDHDPRQQYYISVLPIMHRVFIYGSLKSNELNSFHMADESHGKAVFIGNGKTSKKWPVIFIDYKEYTHFPAMIYEEGMGHQVEGEIWEIDDNFLKWLDKFEGHPDLYCRKTMQITHADDSQEETCYIYVFANFKGSISESPIFLRSYNSAECGRPYKKT